MPGGDGTGPLGLGPMTGRGAGYCAGYPAPGYANPIFGRGGGSRYGRSFGRGRGWGRGYGNLYTAPSYPANVSPKQEADMLKTEVKAMQDEINRINQHIKELEGGQS